MDTRLILKQGKLEYFILKLLSNRESYGAQLFRTLHDGYGIQSEATVYNILHALEKERKIAVKKRDKDAKKVIYSITNRGRRFLKKFEDRMEKEARMQNKDKRFWSPFSFGILFPLWFPLFLPLACVTIFLTLLLSAIIIVLPMSLAAIFGYAAVQVILGYLSASTVWMALGMFVAVLLFIACLGWLHVFIKWSLAAFRLTCKVFRAMFGFMYEVGEN
ncbi:MAG: PadR family transcriptional regulator [Clostridia bacterium]|nr:PadR family transcriptional regulator [Clostridia bacterium]